MVREPNVAQSSGRVGSITVHAPAVPLRSAMALGLLDVAMLALRAFAVLLLLSPLIVLGLLVFG
jgi:hypothetical protein